MFDYVCLRRSFVLMSLLGCALGQAPESGWREPSNVIRDLVVAPGKPSPSLSPQGNLLVMTTRESLPDLGVVARPHLKLAGMRIDGETWSRQLSTKTVAITVRDLSNVRVHTVQHTCVAIGRSDVDVDVCGTIASCGARAPAAARHAHAHA